MTMSKNIDDYVMLANHDLIVIFPIYERLGAIRNTDFGRMVCNSSIFINIYYLCNKN